MAGPHRTGAPRRCAEPQLRQRRRRADARDRVTADALALELDKLNSQRQQVQRDLVKQLLTKAAEAEKRQFKYPGTCREKPYDPSKRHVIRFRMPEFGATTFTDLVKGAISTPHGLITGRPFRCSKPQRRTRTAPTSA